MNPGNTIDCQPILNLIFDTEVTVIVVLMIDDARHMLYVCMRTCD